MADAVQSYQKHARWLPPFHFFVLPVLCATFFMVLRVDVWTLSQRYLEHTVGLKTASALGITGFVWILLAIHLREGVAARLAVHVPRVRRPVWHQRAWLRHGRVGAQRT